MDNSFLVKVAFGTIILLLVCFSTKGTGLVNLFCWLLFVLFLMISVLLGWLKYRKLFENDQIKKGIDCYELREKVKEQMKKKERNIGELTELGYELDGCPKGSELQNILKKLKKEKKKVK